MAVTTVIFGLFWFLFNWAFISKTLPCSHIKIIVPLWSNGFLCGSPSKLSQTVPNGLWLFLRHFLCDVLICILHWKVFFFCFFLQRLLKMVRVNEQLTFTYRSLLEISRRSKSSNHQGNQDFYSFLKTLVEKRQITPIPGGGRSPVGQQLAAAFNELSASDRNSPSDDPMNGSTRLDAGPSSVKRKLPVASIKEFLLRTVAPRPYMFSRPSIHRLYASFRKGDCRIAGAFSEDVIYG